MDNLQGVQLITTELIEATIELARASPRRRKNHNFHLGDADNPHRFLNVFLAGSYVRPHRHLRPPKAESFVVLSGHIVAFVFDDAGQITSRHLIGNGPFSGTLPGAISGARVSHGIDLQPGLWHTIAALSPIAVCYEVKPGPWDPATDKEFASWAPEENSDTAASYLASLLV